MLDRVDPSPEIVELSEYGEYFLGFLDDFCSLRNDVSLDKRKIPQACKFIEEKFKGITRKSGENYHSHLYEVAKIFMENTKKDISTDSIIIALLHDTLEDIPINEEEYEKLFSEIQEQFGCTVAIGVETLSKPNNINEKKSYIQKLSSLSSHGQHIESLALKRKMVTNITRYQGGKSKDNEKFIKILAKIKLSDRIHNLRTMAEDTYKNSKREGKIYETEHTLSHLAGELGNGNFISLLGRALMHAKITFQRVAIREAASGKL